jgi:hypothetical protein
MFISSEFIYDFFYYGKWYQFIGSFQLGLKNDALRIDSGKRINLIVQGSHDS